MKIITKKEIIKTLEQALEIEELSCDVWSDRATMNEYRIAREQISDITTNIHLLLARLRESVKGTKK